MSEDDKLFFHTKAITASEGATSQRHTKTIGNLHNEISHVGKPKCQKIIYFVKCLNQKKTLYGTTYVQRKICNFCRNSPFNFKYSLQYMYALCKL